MAASNTDPALSTKRLKCQCKVQIALDVDGNMRTSQLIRLRAKTAMAQSLRAMQHQSSAKAYGHCYEAKERAKSAQPNNGIRPHGGYRGMHHHPPSPLSFNKPVSYHDQLNEELGHRLSRSAQQRAESKLYCDDDEVLSNQGRPIPPSFLAHKDAYNSYLLNNFTERSDSNVRSAGSRRPSVMHDYLTDTELQGSTTDELQSHLGRATRTTLLRSRHRNRTWPKVFAPISMIPVGKSASKHVHQPAFGTNCGKFSQHILEKTGESVYGFLIGANYNSDRSNPVSARTTYVPRSQLLDGIALPHGNQQDDTDSHAEHLMAMRHHMTKYYRTAPFVVTFEPTSSLTKPLPPFLRKVHYL